MKLSEWIAANGGRAAVARRLGVSPQAVHYWLNRKASPQVKTMKRIEEISKGQVTISAIVDETTPKRKLHS